MACLDASSHRMAQFCWKGVTGITAPRRFAMGVFPAGILPRVTPGVGDGMRSGPNGV